MKYSGIGGQAVLEGIMMKNKDSYAVAVRKADGEIAVMKDTYVSMTEKVKLFSLPFIRGVFNFADSMILGMKTLTWSAGFVEGDEEEEEPGKFEKFLIDRFGEKLEEVLMAGVMVVSVFLAIAVFMVLPLLIAGVFRNFIHSDTVMAVIEGLIRIGIFIGYIKLISRMDDIKRTFMYHGSEHKCINCLEHGLTLSVENVRKSSKEHKRCGTSFLLIVMVISILFFMVIRVDNVWLRILSRIILIPVIAGVSYEVLRLAGTSNSKIMDIISRPGLWMQGLTTKEPDDSMIEVAIAAVEQVFDWKSYLEAKKPAEGGTEDFSARSARFEEFVSRREGREPLQQILGTQEFMGLSFLVNRHVLIPRQDTETLVELVLKEVKDREARILDLCTGSGCIAISLAALGGFRFVAASDISQEALETARENAGRILGDGGNESGKIRFRRSDLLDGFDREERFDVIVSNPPYIPSETIGGLEPEVREFEPRLALDGSADGLLFYRRLAGECGAFLNRGGRVYFEIGHDQGAAVSGLLEAHGFTDIKVRKDLAGNDRVVSAAKGGAGTAEAGWRESNV